MSRAKSTKKRPLAKFEDTMLGSFTPTAAIGPAYAIPGRKVSVFSKWSNEDGVTLRFEVDRYTIFNLEEVKAFRDLLISMCDEIESASATTDEGKDAA